MENVLAEYEPEEIVALLSAFVFGEKTDVVPTITPKLEKGKAKIIEIAKKVNSVQIKQQVLINAESDDFENRPRFGLMEVVYEWAKGMSFNQITDLTDVLEGTIVRVITRLDEVCREVKNSARIIGDPSLFAKMQECQELIKRDVCHCASLYLVGISYYLDVDNADLVLVNYFLISYKPTIQCQSVASQFIKNLIGCRIETLECIEIIKVAWRDMVRNFTAIRYPVFCMVNMLVMLAIRHLPRPDVRDATQQR